MTTGIWLCAGMFAYLGIGTTLTVFISGLTHAVNKGRFPDEAIGPTIALWPATLFVAVVMTVAKSVAMGIRILRRASLDAARTSEAEAAGAAGERSLILAWIAEEKRNAAGLKVAEPLLSEWMKAFDHVALHVADRSRRQSTEPIA